MKSFTACLLCRRDQTGLKLEKKEFFLRPGTRPQVQTEHGNLRLISGFPGLFEAPDIPVSPALQLNADLGGWNEEMLLDIARAELHWKEHTLYRSYTLEPDATAIVCSGDPGTLAGFVETWGGILKITPVLTKGYHPSFITAFSIEIKKMERGLDVWLGVKSPFDLERCSYCGFCGPSCPEDCLREMLFLDFNKCTYCRACIEACPNDAIDLHASEMLELDAGSIICLPDAGIEVARDIPSVYKHNEMDALAASICTKQVEEVVTIDPLLCQHSLRSAAGCTRCIDVCTESAISSGESGLEIDQLKCIECGSCAGTCPTGALQYERFNDRAFYSYISQFDMKPGTKVVMGCAEALHAFWWKNRSRTFPDTLFMEFPRVNALNIFHFLLLLARGAGRVIVLKRNEEETPGACLAQAGLANRIMEILFGAKESVAVIPLKDASSLWEPNSVHITETLSPGGFRTRRREIERILLFLVEHGSGRGDVEPGLSPSFGMLLCDKEACTQCLSCLNECRQGALKAHEQSLILSFKPILCVQCGLCTAVCPEDALKLGPGLVLEHTFFQRQTLVEAEPARCRNCGKVFGTRKSLEKVREILSVRQDLDLELFEYCDECRVKRFLEQEEE